MEGVRRGKGPPNPAAVIVIPAVGAAGWGRQKEPFTGKVGGTGSILESLWSR